MIVTAFHGFCMALADSVPGVSGSTIAFIMGYYERFLMALHGLLVKDPVIRRDSFVYLLKFAVGWGIGIIISILMIARIFETHAHLLSSTFLGLTIAAVPIIIKEEKESIVGRYQNIGFAVTGLVLVTALTLFRTKTAHFSSINFLSLDFEQYIYLAFSGLLAITAMLLPGISGSTLLLIFGVYASTINAVKHVLQLQFEYLPGIIALIVGILLGVSTIARYIRAALKRFRPQMMYFILGLLAGSLYAIVMGPTTMDIPQAPLGFGNFNIIGFCTGICILGGLEILKKRTIKNSEF